MTRTAAQSRIFTNRRHSPTVAPPPTPNQPPSQSIVSICPPTALPAVPMRAGPSIMRLKPNAPPLAVVSPALS